MIICFDIGGSAIKGAIAFSVEDIRPVARQATPGHDFDAFVGVLRSAFLPGAGTPDCVSISIAGVTDPETGILTCANIPCIHGRNIKADLERELGLPVTIANDADCFALAEANIGAGKGYRIVLGIILGTGVGGGVVVDGHLINQDGGFAGEWGHGPAAAEHAGNPPVAVPVYSCGCGQNRCVDSVGGARGMERLHEHYHGQRLTSVEITDGWLAGDVACSRTIDIFVDLLASPLAVSINIVGAAIVPVGGGLSNCEPLLNSIDSAVRKRVLRKFDRPVVVPSVCRVEPGLIGAALLGMQKVEDGKHRS